MKKCIFVLIFLISISSVLFGAEKKDKVVVLGAYFTSTGGQSSSQELDFANTLGEAIGNEFGYKFVTRKYPSDADVQKAFLANEIDAALLWSGHVVGIEKKGGHVFSWATIVVDKQRRVAQCLWVKNTGADVKDISSIVGGTLLAHDYNEVWLIMIREYLFSQGIDKPLWQVFNSFLQVKSMNSAFMALAMGKNDYYWVSRDDTFLKMLSPNLLQQVKPAFCTEPIYARSAVVFNRNTMAEASLIELRDAFLSYYENRLTVEKKYPKVKALYEYLKLAKIKIIPASENEFKVESVLYEKAKKNGWLDEARFIIEKWDAVPVGQPVEIKLDFKACKELCAPKASAGEREICMEKCMK